MMIKLFPFPSFQWNLYRFRDIKIAKVDILPKTGYTKHLVIQWGLKCY